MVHALAGLVVAGPLMAAAVAPAKEPAPAPEPSKAAAPAKAPAPVPEPLNAAALVAGARPVSESGVPQTRGAALLDGLPKSDWEWQKGEESTLVLQLAEPFELSRVEVENAHDEAGYPGLSVRRLKLETGPSPRGPWRPLADLSLKRGTAPQGAAVVARAVRYVRVQALDNYGHDQWFALGELRLLGRRSTERSIRFTGAYDTSFGELVLTQDGARVTGCYGAPGTRAGLYTVEASVEGAVLSGTWTEATDDGSAGNAGALAFALTAEGELSGVYGNDFKDRSARWDGQPKKKATIVCERPEKELGERLAREGRIALRGILFDNGLDTLRPESIPVLEALAAAMKASATTAYGVEGHTDDRGGAAFNQGLSERRAARVKTWLVKAGISADRLSTKGLGLSQPVMPNDSEAGRAANRRVEVVVAQP